MQVFDRTIKDILNKYLDELEKEFVSDVVFYFGEIHPSYEKLFRDFIEILKDEKIQRNRLTVILNTPGGSAESGFGNVKKL